MGKIVYSKLYIGYMFSLMNGRERCNANRKEVLFLKR